MKDIKVSNAENIYVVLLVVFLAFLGELPGVERQLTAPVRS